MLPHQRLAAALAMLTGIAACSAPASGSPTPAASPVATAGRLVERLATAHPDPWLGISERDFRAAASALDERLPTLSPQAQLVEIMRLVALVGAEGRNGHMLALPAAPPGSHRLPVGFHLFADGLHVVEADAAHAELVGARVERIAGMPVAEALERLRPLVNRDNPHTVDWLLPILLESPAILAGAGVAPDPARVELQLALADGDERSLTLEPVATEPYVDLLEAFVSLRLPPRDGLTWLSEQAAEFWTSPMPGSDALYAQYNTIWESSRTYLDGLRRELRRSGSSRLVLDLRLNPGGENPNFAPLLDALREIEDGGIDLVVLIGRGTFSAATAFAVEIARTTDARFVGEPTAGSPTTYASVRPLRLDELALPVVVWVPTQASSFGPPDAETIQPHLPVELRAADYLAGRDPVLAAALALPR